MTALARELLASIVDAIATDPTMAEQFAAIIAPHLPDRSGGWLAAPDAAAYLGLGSLDALDRLVRAGLPSSQPNGPGARRYFSRSALDDWMEGTK